MTIKNNDWVGGTIGGLITGSSTAGTNDAFDSQSPTYPKYATVNGETVAQIVGPSVHSGEQAMLRRVMLEQKLKLRQVFTLSAIPASSLFLERVAHGTTSGTEVGAAFDVEVKASTASVPGRLGLTIAGGADAWLSPAGLAINTEYRLEVYAEAGTSTTTGAIRVTLFQGRNSSTIVADSTLLTGVNVASTSGNFVTARRGKYDGAAYTGTYNILPGLRQATGTDATNSVDPVSSFACTATVSPANPQLYSVQRTITVNATGSNGNAITYSIDDYGDGTGGAPGQSTNTFTHTFPTLAAGAANATYNVIPRVTQAG